MNGATLIMIAVVVVSLALSHQVRPLNILTYSLVAALVFARLWSLFSVRAISVRRQIREFRVQAGQSIEERITVHNSLLIPRLWLQIIDHANLPGHGASRVIDLAPGGTRSWVVRTPCPRRGEYCLGPTTLAGADPLGLFKTQRDYRGTQRILVYPKTVELPAFSVPTANLLGGQRRRTGFQQTTPQASEVREYAPGDPLNRIHWPTTARAGRLMVKEFDTDPTADVWIYLDLERGVHVGEGDESTEEYGVTIAASLAKHFLQQNRNVGLVASCGLPVILPADRGDRQYLKMLEALAVVHADGTMPLANLLAAEGFRSGGHSTALVITPSLDDAWVGALRQMRYSGVRAEVIELEAITFGGSESSLLHVSAAAAADLPLYLVKRGDALEQALLTDVRRLAVPRR